MENITSWLYGPTTFKELKEFKIFIQDDEHTVKTTEISPDTTLNTYLRKNAFLTGTKYMCLEGGCGACVVAVTATDPLTMREKVYAVNSCLVPIYLCSSKKIHTVESIGNSVNGFHPVQNALVKFNGTQCGYCSPGMVMSMYALYESGEFKMKDVEKAFGGNICRCTGYRPILSAFKSLASDASPETLGTVSDIEDFPSCIQKPTWENCVVQRPEQFQPHCYTFLKSRWIKVFSINEIFDVFKQCTDETTYMLVSGDTAKGVYKRKIEPQIYIDITSVKNLLQYTINNDSLVIGANITLTNTIQLFYKLAEKYQKFEYLRKLSEHIELVANLPVRNIGTLAGNLFIKHEHPEFPSDIFLILETIGATVVLENNKRQEKIMSLESFLDYNMKKTIIRNIILPAFNNTYRLETYKIMPRAENAHAMVNAGFLFKLTPKNKVELARIVYGGINPTFVHAKKSEKYLINQDIFNSTNMQELFKILIGEVQPDYNPPDPTPTFRKKLAVALCYKFILSIAPTTKISPRNISGGRKKTRPVSSGTQDYETNESLYPITQPISKIEAIAQCSGEAQYIMDIPDYPNQLFAAFVLAKAPPNSTIDKIDAAKALDINGVVAFYSKDDIPGKNNFMPINAGPFNSVEEEIFCSGIVKYYHQPIGIVVATSQKLAEKAADLIDIKYVDATQKPLLTIQDIINAKAENKIHLEAEHKATDKGKDVKHIIKGKFYNGWQYHFSMETQCCVVVNVEDGLDMFPATQTMNYAQISAAEVLNVPVNRINVTVRRLGGAYGGKISRNTLVSCAAALASYKLKRPVKLWMPLSTNMEVIGKRCPCYSSYEVGCDDNGVIQYLNAEVYSDFGSSGGNENLAGDIANIFPYIYKSDTWDFKVYSTRSDCHTGTPCRAPGTTEAVAASETIMEHIASTLNLDPIQVRNSNAKIPEVSQYFKDIVNWAEIEKRKQEIKEFNESNRWVKKGIATVPMVFPFRLFGNWGVLISIYQGDGSVSVAHGGIEMGQGINTKAAQVCAYSLGIPLNQVSIKPSNVLVTPNAMTSGGSITTEAVCYAIVKVCDTLKERMKPIKEKMKVPTWPKLVRQCYLENVDLTETFMFQPKLPGVKNYNIFGATCAEVEIDILTGVYQVNRVDIIEDTGNSMSPQIDIGQVEGAFIMGMGYWTMENIIFSPKGQLLTNNTWTYKTPGAKDIPIDFRVKFPKKNPNPVGVFNSKATSEPPLVMACSVPFAIRNAVASAKLEVDPNVEKWYPMDGPSTVENTFLNCLHDITQYKL